MDYDFDINHYTLSDWKHLLRLPETFTAGELDKGFEQTLERMDKIPGIDTTFRNQFSTFLQKGRAILMKTVRPDEITRLELAETYPKPVVQKQDLPYVYSHSSEFFGGTLNPLERHLSIRMVSIDSLFRPSGSQSNDFIFVFPEPIKQVASLELMSIEFPVRSFYNVSANQSVTVVKNGTSYTLTLDEGSYTPNTLVASLNTLLQGFGLTNMDFSVDPDTNKIILTSNTSISLICWSNGERTPYLTLGWLLGFRQPSYSGTSIISDCPNSIVDTSYLYLEIDDFNRNNQTQGIIAYKGTDGSYISNNLLARISLQELAYQGIVRTHKRREYFGSVRLDKLRIRLIDRFGRPADISGSDWSFLIQLNQIYE